MSMCKDCPYNGGLRGEEIICRLDHDPRNCSEWTVVELYHMPPPEPEDWTYSESGLAYEEDEE